jgi:hypothetical protein
LYNSSLYAAAGYAFAFAEYQWPSAAAMCYSRRCALFVKGLRGMPCVPHFSALRSSQDVADAIRFLVSRLAGIPYHDTPRRVAAEVPAARRHVVLTGILGSAEGFACSQRLIAPDFVVMDDLFSELAPVLVDGSLPVGSVAAACKFLYPDSLDEADIERIRKFFTGNGIRGLRLFAGRVGLGRFIAPGARDTVLTLVAALRSRKPISGTYQLSDLAFETAATTFLVKNLVCEDTTPPTPSELFALKAYSDEQAQPPGSGTRLSKLCNFDAISEASAKSRERQLLQL